MKRRARIYLDVCCINRPFDNQRQERIHMEAEAVELILERVRRSSWVWVGSDVVDLEVSRIPDPERLERVSQLLAEASEIIVAGDVETKRARELSELGFKAMDAFHVACAESGLVEVMLTTDDALLRMARKHDKVLRVSVKNPLGWIAEQVEP